MIGHSSAAIAIRALKALCDDQITLDSSIRY
jgi:hypothetical protein